MNTIITSIVTCILLTSAAWGATINVPDPGQGILTIQDGIDAASNGDVVVVALGAYTEGFNFNNKSITVRSTDPTNPAVVDGTVIDLQNATIPITIESGEGPDTVLSGFRIINGGILTLGIGSAAVLIMNSDPTVSYCTIADSHIGGGGCIYNLGASPTVTQCRIENNTFSFVGAGMHNAAGSHPTVTDCVFENNQQFENMGGGMLNSEGSNPTVTDCAFMSNTSFDEGGGMMNFDSSPHVERCLFNNNQADLGGGIYNDSGSHPTVTDCAFNANSAGFAGGGMMNIDSSPTVTDCAFRSNSAAVFGGGMMNVRSSAIVTNCAFRGNSSASDGGGLYISGAAPHRPTLTDCTICGNTPEQIGLVGAGAAYIDGGGNDITTVCTIGACCLGTGGCGEWTVAECALVGGYYQGDGGICWTVNACRGACCFDDGSCSEIHYQDCLAGGGVHQGSYTDCIDVGCAVTCDGDTNGDTAVNTDDFLAVLSNWGDCDLPCPPQCTGELTDDCTVNTDDFLAVLSHWGPCPAP